MQDNKVLFQTFSDARLIEIVKNASQFGYDDTTVNIALDVLKERGITENDLLLTGNLTNHKFDYARELYRSYNISASIAFVSYFLAILLKTIFIFHFLRVYEASGFLYILYRGAIIIFLVALVKSFFDHMNFYRTIDKQLGAGDQIIFFLLGMPFYIFMHFFYKSRMKEEMLMIR